MPSPRSSADWDDPRRVRAADPPAGLLRAGHRAGLNMHLYWVRRGGRRLARGRQVGRMDARKAAARARSSPPVMPRAGNDIPSCCPPPRRNGWTAATASRAASRSAASRRSGRASGCTAWTRATPRRPRSSTLHAARRQGLPDRGDLGRARDAGHAQRRHGPRGRLRPRRVHRARRPGGRRGGRPLRPLDLRLGAGRASRTSTTAGPPRAGPDPERREASGGRSP